MTAEHRQLICELIQLARRPHYRCEEDTWYSCPLAPDGCANDSILKGVCNCSAESHNAQVKKLESLLLGYKEVPGEYTLTALVDLLERTFGNVGVIVSNENRLNGSSSSSFTLEERVLATWDSRLASPPVYDGVTPRGASIYYNLKFYD